MSKVRFWSSTEYSGFMAGLMRELTSLGFDSAQCFNISEGSYRSANSTIARLVLRFRQYVLYPIQLIISLGRRRCSRDSGEDICVVSTNTFYAPFLATYLHPNVIHLVYDLFPEAMIHSGKWEEGTLKVKAIRWITLKTLRRAKCNVFLGERLKRYVESIHGSVPNSEIIAVGADQSLFNYSPLQRCSRQLHNTTSSVTDCIQQTNVAPAVLYCGNFGNMHESETLFQYWNNVSDSFKGSVLSFKDRGNSDSCLLTPDFSCQLYWRFHCSGPKRAELEAVRADLPDVLKDQIHLGGGLDQPEWIRTMEMADVALVTMVPGSETVVMPSKTYSAMMAGQAILAIAPEDSDLVDTIKVAECGWWVEPGDVEGLSQVVEAICADADDLLQKRENAFRYAHAHLGQDALAKEWEHALRAI